MLPIDSTWKQKGWQNTQLPRLSSFAYTVWTRKLPITLFKRQAWHIHVVTILVVVFELKVIRHYVGEMALTLYLMNINYPPYWKGYRIMWWMLYSLFFLHLVPIWGWQIRKVRIWRYFVFLWFNWQPYWICKLAGSATFETCRTSVQVRLPRRTHVQYGDHTIQFGCCGLCNSSCAFLFRPFSVCKRGKSRKLNILSTLLLPSTGYWEHVCQIL